MEDQKTPLKQPLSRLGKETIPFTMVANCVLNDQRLSLKAKGLFAYLYSKPDGWHFSYKRIAQDHKEGERAILVALNELTQCGYLRRKKRNDGRMDYYLTYNPKLQVAKNAVCKKRSLQKPQSAENAVCGKRSLQKTQSAEIATINNKDKEIIKNNNNKEGSENKFSLTPSENNEENSSELPNDEPIYEEPPKDTYKTKAKIFAKKGLNYKPPKPSKAQETAWNTELLARYLKDKAMELHGVNIFFDKTQSGKHWKATKRATQILGLDEAKKLVDAYLSHPKFEDKLADFGIDPAIVFSNASINLFKAIHIKRKPHILQL